MVVIILSKARLINKGVPMKNALALGVLLSYKVEEMIFTVIIQFSIIYIDDVT